MPRAACATLYERSDSWARKLVIGSGIGKAAFGLDLTIPVKMTATLGGSHGACVPHAFPRCGEDHNP